MWVMWSALLFAASLAMGPQPVMQHRFVVVVDAGHGGDNAGCVAFDGHTPEKEVTLALARRVATAITEELPHAEVRLTREEDASLTLEGRVAQANAAGATLFLSLHANASPHHHQAGFETFVLDAQASSADAAWTARRENGEGTAKSSIARTPAAIAPHEADLMVRELELAAHRAAALRFAGALQRAQAARFPERQDRGVRQAPFDVLIGARMPAVLFEVGFLDHPEEGAQLLLPQTQAEIAEGVADAVAEHYRELRQTTPWRLVEASAQNSRSSVSRWRASEGEKRAVKIKFSTQVPSGEP